MASELLPLPPTTRRSPRAGREDSRRALEGLQESDEVVFVPRRKIQIESLVVEVYGVEERCRRAVMEVRRAPRETSQDGSLNLANMVEPAINQGLSEIACRLTVARRQARSCVLFAHGDLRQVAQIQAPQIDGAVGWAG